MSMVAFYLFSFFLLLVLQVPFELAENGQFLVGDMSCLVPKILSLPLLMRFLIIGVGDVAFVAQPATKCLLVVCHEQSQS